MVQTHFLSGHDVLVVGSGAAGLSAAITAAVHGQRPLVIEKTPLVGGTTALSEGMIWVPNSAQARARGIQDSAESALRYVQATAGSHFNQVRAKSYIEHAPQMLAFLETNSAVRFDLVPGSIDYYEQADGSLNGGRSLRPRLFDGRLLKSAFGTLRPPLATTMILGGLAIASADLPHYFSLGKSWRSRLHVAGVAARYAKDRLAGWPRGTRIGNGNALVAALWWSLMQLGGKVVTQVRLDSLIRSNDGKLGAIVEAGGRTHQIWPQAGIILAGGGFPGNKAWRKKYFQHFRAGKNHISIAPETNTGDTIAAAIAIGAALDDNVSNPAAWSPASSVVTSGGALVPFPHYIDRGKPGIIAVNHQGRRFTNEAQPYQDFVPAMIKAAEAAPVVESYLIADHRAIRRYGIGVVPPAPGRLEGFVRNGYLVRAPSLESLGRALNLPEGALEKTVDRFNVFARSGCDPDFGRGSSAYGRAVGDPENIPNPSLGPLDCAPFYAVCLQPGDIGTLVGLSTDECSRVLDSKTNLPIKGLYAAGNDSVSPMGGEYPAAGITIGAALTFGYLAGLRAAKDRQQAG